MFSLINKDDSKIMKNSRFVKNAVFYKDMFAFFEVYKKIMAEDKSSLPNFCLFPNNEYCLEGICLFMKIYASEFGFETINLTLDYLKVLYFTIAGYSKDGLQVDESLIKKEFEEYKKSSVQMVAQVDKEIKKAKDDYDKNNKKYEKLKSKYANNLVVSKFYRVFKIITFVMSFFGAMLPFSFYYLGKVSLKITILSSVAVLTVGIIIFLIFKILTSKTESTFNESAYILQTLKKERDLSFEAYNDIKIKNNRIISEKYEYLHSINDTLKTYFNHISFDEILTKAAEHKLISYNIVNDVKNLFESQQKDVCEMCNNIIKLQVNNDTNKILTDIYRDICKSDWLYFNNEVRFNLIKKHIEVSQKSHEWFMNIDDVQVSPFGVDIKKIAKEEIAYLNSKDELFVASSIDKFLNTKYAKELNTFELKGCTNAELLKNLKVDYINHFFDYNKVKKFDNLFYDCKILEGVKISDDIINENEKIPTYIYIKLKLLENSIGLGNNSFSVIKQIAEEINKNYVTKLTAPMEPKQYVFTERNISYSDFECENIEQIDKHLVKYVIGENRVVGFKLANI